MTRYAHTHACAGLLIGGSCPTRIQCVGPLDADGWCPGDDDTWCDDCRAMVEDGKRCDSCGLLDASVGGPHSRDKYCPACLAIADEPVAEPTHGGAREH